MRFGEQKIVKKQEIEKNTRWKEDTANTEKHVNPSILAHINYIKANQETYHTFDTLKAEIEYEIYEDEIDGFLLGVAIYTADRKITFLVLIHIWIIFQCQIPGEFTKWFMKFQK